MALINTRNSAHDFSVKLSPCMCSHSSCPDWRNGWHDIRIPRWDLPTCASSGLAYYSHVTVDSDTSCCVPWQIIIKPAVCCLLRLTPQWWIIFRLAPQWWIIFRLAPRWCIIFRLAPQWWIIFRAPQWWIIFRLLTVAIVESSFGCCAVGRHCVRYAYRLLI